MVRRLSCIKPTQKFVPAHFALIINIVVHVIKHQSVLINTCRRQESLAPENDAGFLKVIIFAAVHVAS